MSISRKTIFEDFNLIRNDFIRWAPPVVYKYRSWETSLQRSLLIDRIAWFAHPFTLEDPKDVRHDYNIETRYYNTLYFFEKLLKYIKRTYPALNGLPRIKKIHSIWKRIQADPEGYFHDNLDKLHKDRRIYNAYGIFSTSLNGLEKCLWEKYGDNFKGYCIGFNTPKFYEDVQCSCRKVEYSDEAMTVSLLGLEESQVEREEYLKKKIWSFEDEFRFITLNIGGSKRDKEFRSESVKEVLIGYLATNETKEEICTIIKTKYSNNIDVYEAVLLSDGKVWKKRIDILCWAK